MFNFIWDETEKHYNLWWDGFEHCLGTLKEIEDGLWECCPYWQAHLRLQLQYMKVEASCKETAAMVWLAEGAEDEN